LSFSYPIERLPFNVSPITFDADLKDLIIDRWKSEKLQFRFNLDLLFSSQNVFHAVLVKEEV
jgi:hypothetical protein